MTAPVVTPQAMPAPGPAVVEAPDANLPMVAPRATARTPAKTRARSVSRWVSLVARDWVVVRAGASKQSRIVASIGPNSHVQLGESRGTWRRIRAKGLSGWVEPRSSFVGARAR
jgi:SH3-like domain-containing protein